MPPQARTEKTVEKRIVAERLSKRRGLESWRVELRGCKGLNAEQVAEAEDFIVEPVRLIYVFHSPRRTWCEHSGHNVFCGSFPEKRKNPESRRRLAIKIDISCMLACFLELLPVSERMTTYKNDHRTSFTEDV